jgi:hypothetical protein
MVVDLTGLMVSFTLLWEQWVTLMINNLITAPNIPVSEGGTNSSHMHNLAESQRDRGLKLLPSDTKFMKTENSMFVCHTFQNN